MPLTVGRVSVVLALAAATVSLKVDDYDRAEANLKTYYARMEAADFKAATSSINEALRLWPSNARYHGWRGYVASQQLPSQCQAHGVRLDANTIEQAHQAAAYYQHSLELNGRDAVAHHNLAWLHHILGQDQNARRGWERAVAIDPGTAVYQLALGLFLEEAGDTDGAMRRYVAAIEATPVILDSPFFFHYRNRFPDRAGAVVQQAVADIERRLHASDDPILKARLGKLYLFRGDLHRAAALLEDAAKDLPNLPMVWFNLGEVQRLQKNDEQAWGCYQKAHFLDGGQAGPKLRMGQMYLTAGQRKPAADALRSAAQKWTRVKPVTAGHNTRLYGGIPQPIDDLLPTTFVWYTTACQASEAYVALAGLFPDNKLYASRSTTCESLPAPHSGGN